MLPELVLPKWPQPFGWRQKLNPLWWLGNADDPWPTTQWANGQPYELWASYPQWLRWLLWRFRNLLHNGQWYVWGIADKIHWRLSHFPGNWHPTGGFNYAWCGLALHDLWRPYISWWQPWTDWQFCLGWKEKGDFGCSLRRRHGGI